VISSLTLEAGRRLKGPRVKVVVNPRPSRGISTSIRRGLQVLDPRSQGILIVLGDQPGLTAKTVNALIRAFAEHRGGMVVPIFQGRRGHPVLFDRRYRKELSKLNKDVGGRFLLQEHPERVLEVPTKSKGVVKDIDTWKDYMTEIRRKP
jgi:molybdenum cofactor cytidylyltransferase